MPHGRAYWLRTATYPDTLARSQGAPPRRYSRCTSLEGLVYWGPETRTHLTHTLTHSRPTSGSTSATSACHSHPGNIGYAFSGARVTAKPQSKAACHEANAAKRQLNTRETAASSPPWGTISERNPRGEYSRLSRMGVVRMPVLVGRAYPGRRLHHTILSSAPKASAPASSALQRLRLKTKVPPQRRSQGRNTTAATQGPCERAAEQVFVGARVRCRTRAKTVHFIRRPRHQ